MEDSPLKKAKEKLQDDFPLEQIQVPSAQSVHSEPKKTLSFFRFIIWLSPGPACLIALPLLYQYFFPPAVFVILFCILLTLLIGICDSFLSASVSKKDGRPEWPAAFGHSFVFTALQLIIAPLTIFVLGLGFCAVIVVTNA